MIVKYLEAFGSAFFLIIATLGILMWLTMCGYILAMILTAVVTDRIGQLFGAVLMITVTVLAVCAIRWTVIK